MASGGGQANFEGNDSLQAGRSDVSKSTDRRYNQVVQEYMKRNLLKSDSERSSISPSQVLSLHADKAGPNEGSYVSWECPDTPQSQKFAASKDRGSETGTPLYSFIDDPDPANFHSLDSKMTSTAQSVRNPTGGFQFGSDNSKASFTFEDAFQNTDPFSPCAENVVSLSFCSLPSPEELEMKTPHSDNNQSPASGGAPKDSGKRISPPKLAFVFPSPNKNKPSKQGPVMTTFSKLDDVKENEDNSPLPLGTPTESQDSSVSHHTPSIWVTNVRGSSHNLLGGPAKTENSPRRIQSWTGEPTPSDEKKSRMKQYERRALSESVYPPEESNRKSYTFHPSPISSNEKRAHSFDTSNTTMHMLHSPSPSPNYFASEDLYYNHDKTDYERKLDRQERIGWCLIIFGISILISAVIVILVIEIPAHDFEEEEFEPDSKSFFDYMENVQEDVLSALQ
ncbi:uncharacterized protein LOC135206195 isoform X2 [Macrobrachium nipponense]|uniref:uncharacterized protein LOC135206195 isoform X2 n=1 Tax=Macrobrachium nipponense TaxID=159736 RepID=UPI0030C7D892